MFEHSIEGCQCASNIDNIQPLCGPCNSKKHNKYIDYRRQHQMSDTFNPNQHLLQLKSRDGVKDYLPVQWRLVWFRQECPQGIIETEELEYDTEKECSIETFVWNSEKRRSEKVVKTAKGYARYRAVVTDGKGGRATGTKAECRANFEDY